MTVPRMFAGFGNLLLAVCIISVVAITSVITIKTLYQHLNPTSQSVEKVEFQIGSTLKDVVGFTN